MRIMLKIAVACLSLAMATPSLAAQKNSGPSFNPALRGVWAGTIGAIPVHVCVDDISAGVQGTYYYDRVRKLLPLAEGNVPGELFEQDASGKNGARWRISINGDGILGGWNDGKKQLPIALKRIKVPRGEGSCGSKAFHSLRLAPPKLVSKTALVDGAKVTIWTFKPGPWFGDAVEISTFTLDRPGAPSAKINAWLKRVLPKPDGTGDWFDCIVGVAETKGTDGEYSATIEPKLISDRWMTAIESRDEYCGGMHPNNVVMPRTFDLTTGAEVDPLDWLSAKAVHRDGPSSDASKTLTPAFVAMILKDYKVDPEQDAECDEDMRTQESWFAGIQRGALVFSPDFPRVMQACGDDIVVPFARLQPWLSDKGKAIVATLPR